MYLFHILKVRLILRLFAYVFTVILPSWPVYDGRSGVCLGSVVCDTRGDQCCEVDLLSVDPTCHGCGIGRVLMVTAMDQVTDANNKPLTFRLTQVVVNSTSFCLYAVWGSMLVATFSMEFQGLPSQDSDHRASNLRASNVEVWRATVDVVFACNVLYQEAHGGGMGRSNGIHDAVTHGQNVHGWHVYVLTDSKDGSITAYTTGLHVFGHTVARNEATYKLFIKMLSVKVAESERRKCRLHIDPVHYPDLSRWMLAAKMRVEKQHTMMTTECYIGPVSPFVYCPTMDYWLDTGTVYLLLCHVVYYYYALHERHGFV